MEVLVVLSMDSPCSPACESLSELVGSRSTVVIKSNQYLTSQPTTVTKETGG